MADFLLYWRPSTVDSIPPGRVQFWAGSNHIGKGHVAPGDVIWATTSRGKDDLRLVARIPVARVFQTRQDAVAVIGEQAWPAAERFAVGLEADCRTIQDIDLGGVAARLTFEGKTPRLREGFNVQSLQQMRRLTQESVSVLHHAWRTGAASDLPQFDWVRDELILALDVFMRFGQKLPPSHDHPAVTALSELLRRLPVHPHRGEDPTFRNARDVYLKLSDFGAIANLGNEMRATDRIDRQVFDDFSSDLPRLRSLANAIEQASWEVLDAAYAADESEEACPEGRIIYRLHRSRERNREIVERKRRQALRRRGNLACEVCGFDFEAQYGEVGAKFIECHHTTPLSVSSAAVKTTLKDLALVCANCHRMLHRGARWLTVADLRSLVLTGASSPRLTNGRSATS